MCVSFLSSSHSYRLCFLILLVSAPLLVWSQSPMNYLDATNPDRGYWQLHTDHTSRNTIIRLYNNQNELVYEEVMPGQYIKLTDKTINQINETLQLVASNKLIIAKVKTFDINAGYSSPPPPMELTDVSMPAEVNKEYARVHVDVYAAKIQRKLIVRYNNPNRRRLSVTLRDESGRLLFAEYTTQEQHGFKIDMNDLKQGRYKLSVASPYQKANFRQTYPVVVGPQHAIEVGQPEF